VAHTIKQTIFLPSLNIHWAKSGLVFVLQAQNKKVTVRGGGGGGGYFHFLMFAV
jgi:hypothetical protein